MYLNNRSRKTNRQARTGFTLPELLVATALSLAVMAIIAVAFQKGIDAFRILRAVASMQDKLKSAENVIKLDLASEHFSGTFRPGYGGPFLRDQRLDLTGWLPPDEGYFTITQLTASVPDGRRSATDSDGLPSYMATNHSLQFTVKLSGKRDEDYCRAIAPNPLLALGPNSPDFNPAGQLCSRWAEVGYFLAVPPGLSTPPTTNGNSSGTPLYTLYRRQRVALSTETLATINTNRGQPIGTTSVVVSGANLSSFYPDISLSASINNATQTIANCSSDLTRAAARMSLAPITGTNQGDDILLTNVISFEVKLNWSNGTAAGNAPVFPGPTTTNDWPFPQSAITFDTGTRQGANANINWDDPTSYTKAAGIPARIRVNAIQIRIRIWDNATQTARQLTIVQDV